jgi:uncharacterized membrane protein
MGNVSMRASDAIFIVIIIILLAFWYFDPGGYYTAYREHMDGLGWGVWLVTVVGAAVVLDIAVLNPASKYTVWGGDAEAPRDGGGGCGCNNT